ncbi:MAG: IS1595 family transposase [Turicibacter sp.]
MFMQTIIDLLPNLSQDDLNQLSTVLSDRLIQQDFSLLSVQIKEQRYASGYLNCPFCQHTHVVKNGQRQGIQRYLCRHCKKSFCTQTLTPSAYSKKSSTVWMSYLDCLLAGFSLRKCAQICEIHLSTAFFWRHKLLEAFKCYLKVGEVSGLIEADECFFRFSQKGQRKTGATCTISQSKPTKKRGISSQQVAVGTALDRQGNLILGLLGRGPMKYEPLKRLFDGRIAPHSTLCTDSAHSYKKLAREMNLEHIALPTGIKKQDIFHINHINTLHKNLKSFMYPFKGVATKHLDHYLYYFKCLETLKGEKENLKRNFIYLNTHATYSQARQGDIKNRKPAYV